MTGIGGQVAVVTGAAGNLGRAVADTFLAAGARLVLVDRSPDRLPAAYPALAGSSEHWLAGGVSLTDQAAVDGLIAEAEARFGRVDILVHTVGGFTAGPKLHEGAPDDWDAMWSINLKTALYACRAVVPGMLARGHGRIVTVGAMAALSAPPGFGPYAAAKSAVMRLTESLAGELKSAGITVNCLLPGIIDTPQNRAAMPNADPSTWVKPAAIAEVVAFLAGEGGGAVTGALIPVTGRG